MTFNKNNDDIIDVEFVVDANQKPSMNQDNQVNEPTDSFVSQYQFHSNHRQDRFSSRTASWGMKNKNIKFFSKQNSLTLILLSPFIILFLLIIMMFFFGVFILFSPKVIKSLKNKGRISNQNEFIRNMFNNKR